MPAKLQARGSRSRQHSGPGVGGRAGRQCGVRGAAQSVSATAEALQARMDAITPARARLESSHPSLLVKKGLLVADVDAILGMAKEAQMTTCGSKSSGDQWSCLVRTYCSIWGCVMVLFRRNGDSGDWVVDTLAQGNPVSPSVSRSARRVFALRGPSWFLAFEGRGSMPSACARQTAGPGPPSRGASVLLPRAATLALRRARLAIGLRWEYGFGRSDGRSTRSDWREN